jgi:hypothetical protein
MVLTIRSITNKILAVRCSQMPIYYTQQLPTELYSVCKSFPIELNLPQSYWNVLKTNEAWGRSLCHIATLKMPALSNFKLVLIMLMNSKITATYPQNTIIQRTFNDNQHYTFQFENCSTANA